LEKLEKPIPVGFTPEPEDTIGGGHAASKPSFTIFRHEEEDTVAEEMIRWRLR